jgi:hypothetical protein
MSMTSEDKLLSRAEIEKELVIRHSTFQELIDANLVYADTWKNGGPVYRIASVLNQIKENCKGTRVYAFRTNLQETSIVGLTAKQQQEEIDKVKADIAEMRKNTDPRNSTQLHMYEKRKRELRAMEQQIATKEKERK